MRYTKFALRLTPLAAIGLSAAFLSPSANAQAYSYDITDLGVLFNYPTQAYGINNSGVTVGNSISGVTGSTANHAFYNDGTIHDIGTPKGTTANYTSLAYGINNSGIVVGSDTGLTAPNAASPAQAYSYDTTSGTKTYLGILSGGANSTARAINSSGLIAGYASTSSGTGVYHAVSAQAGTAGLTDLGTLGGSSSQAYGVNTGGTIVGLSTVNATLQHAFSYANGTMKDIGASATVNGSTVVLTSAAYAVNASGMIVGATSYVNGKDKNGNPTYTSGTATASLHAATFDGNGGYTDLGTLPGRIGSVAVGINSLGQIVGNSSVFNSTTSITEYTAFIDQNGTMTDLNGQVRNLSNWHLQYATGINDNGQIVGYGTFGTGNSIHAFILNQTPAPSSLLVVALGAIPAVGMLRRRRK